MMEIYGATLHSSPSPVTEYGRSLLAENPDHHGSLGIAISEAVAVAAADPSTRYALGSVLNHVLLHQTIIGEEALLQLAEVGETPDLLVGCTGGGSNFGGLAFPFLREKLAGRMDPTIRCVEPAACPSLTKGEYRYDFGDTAGMTPLLKMHTLGHGFIPEPIHAGGLRYHGMAPLVSHIYELGPGRGVAIPQRECFAAALQFARSEGIVPAPEPTHALAAAIREALALQGGRRVEGHPHRPVRPRPPRPRRLRAVPRRARWSTTSCPTTRSPRRWPTCPCSLTTHDRSRRLRRQLVDDIEYAVLAEELGFSHLWFADSQMLWSDCYATMALAAARTERIKIGTGVAVAGTRTSAVTAAAHATINRLAPGRVFCAVGTGNTASRVMGAQPMPIAEFERYIEELRVLLDGGEADVAFRGGTRPVRHLMPDAGFVAFEPRIPLYVSGFGPRAMALAVRHGDGLVMSIPPTVEGLERAWARVDAAAADAGTVVDRATFLTCTLTTMVVLQPGETIESASGCASPCGAFAIAGAALPVRAVEGGRPARSAAALRRLGPLRRDARPTDPERLHQRIHQGHNCWVVDEEWEFVTPELIEATCMVGTPADLAAGSTTLGDGRPLPGDAAAAARRQGGGAARRRHAR